MKLWRYGIVLGDIEAHFSAHAQKRYLGASNQKSDSVILCGDLDFL